MYTNKGSHIGGVLVSMLAFSVVDRGFVPWSGKTKDYETDICCFSAKHAALRKKSKDWLAWNWDNVTVTEWGYMSIRRLLLGDFLTPEPDLSPGYHFY
jgi:hypothetical protein